MKTAQDIIVRPIITEDSMARIADKTYTFEVMKSATKPEIADAVEKLFHVQRIFSQQAALEHECIGCRGGITHLTVANNALVCINLDEDAMLGNAVDVANPQIGDFELRGR